MKTKAIMMSLLLMLLGAATGWAQSGQITVESFQMDETDMSARTKETAKEYKGKNCAILKIVNPNTGFKFELGHLKIQGQKVINGQTWVWVPAGTERILIKHDDLGMLASVNGDGYYEFGAPLKAGTVYVMHLGSGTVEVNVKRDAGQQFLEFHISPIDAILEVDGNIWDVNADGIGTKSLAYGEHQYRVSHPDYHQEAGIANVRNKKEKEIVTISLKPHFGSLEVLPSNQDMNGADVLLDGQRVGKVPYTNEKLSSGSHTLRVSKSLYKTSEEIDIVITDGERFTHSVELEPNFATTRIVVDGDPEADIYINGEKRATGVFDGPLEAGNYNVEARKEHHRTTQTVVNVDNSGERKSFPLAAPVPITGHLSIQTEPMGCTVYVDGKLMSQQTNCILSDLLEGTRNIRIEKAGFATINKSVEIRENETSSMDEHLNSRIHVDIKVTPSYYDYLMVNGKKYSWKEAKEGLEMEVGNYTMWAYDHSYSFGPDRKSKPKMYYVNSNHNVVHIKMKEIFVKRTNYYLDGVFQVGGAIEYGGGIGVTIKGVNFEGGLTMPLKPLPDVYWYKPDSDEPDANDFKISNFYAKLGYSVRATNRFIITPQVGMRASLLEGDITTYATNLTFGIRFGYVLCYGVQFFLTPEYWLPNKEGATFQRMAEYIKDYRNLNDGFNLKMGLSFVFNSGKK